MSGFDRVLRWCGILFFGAVTFFFIRFGVEQLREAAFFARNAVTVEAVCTATAKGTCTREVRGRTGGVVRITEYTCYRPEVTYVFQGQSYTRRLSEAASDTPLAEGTPVTLRVLVKPNGGQQVLPMEDSFSFWIGALLLLAFSLLPLLVFVVMLMSEVGRWRTPPPPVPPPG
ncbi:DUF3592 domain-containing protein [Corallococcus llansteffanensis]|uniref:DUF3592 domain-containing protein n=1 Tax=Corallococcus llansteffanensis TaxID=2316731 RepID=A0A3A8PD83_9BACT|nr:DUF3592 domain-containing protein [Corallococcus llansteffanensis]RKH50442.1 hypothetical protein D7V93_30555 [Corallococcus llansteffanensis]